MHAANSDDQAVKSTIHVIDGNFVSKSDVRFI